jgi:hypothetical protein
MLTLQTQILTPLELLEAKKQKYLASLDKVREYVMRELQRNFEPGYDVTIPVSASSDVRFQVIQEFTAKGWQISERADGADDLFVVTAPSLDVAGDPYFDV